MLYSIQFLRGIAALMVVMAHINTKGHQFNFESLRWMNVGGSGVDLFFIISGFIMCFVTHKREISFIDFFKGRVRRIIPLYWTLSSLALIAYLVCPEIINSSGGETSIISSFTLIPNGDKYLIQNGWTLSYEFLYYIIFSAFILITKKRELRYIGIITLITALVLIGIYLQPKLPIISFLTNNLVFEFVLGVICFIIFNKVYFPAKYSVLSLSIGLIALAIENQMGVAIGPRAIHWGIPMMLIFAGVLGLEKYFRNRKSIFIDAFEYLGKISFSLYLSHPFSLVIIARALRWMDIKNPFVFTTSMLASALVTGIVVYKLLESSFFRKKISG